MFAKPLDNKGSAKPNAVKLSEAEAMQKKAISDSHDSDKQKKDVQLRNIAELEKHMQYLNERTLEMTKDYDLRKKVLEQIGANIQAAQYELSSIQAKFNQQNEKLLAELKRREADIISADEKLQKLIAENASINRDIKVKSSALDQERFTCHQQVEAMKQALTQNNAEMSRQLADIAEREKALAEKEAALEAERASIEPEFARISSIKNENLLLLQKVDMDRKDMENMRLSIENERRMMEEKQLAAQGRVKQELEKVANEEARLRKWEQDLKDFALELKVQNEQAQRVLRREQLEREIKSAEQAKEKK